MTLEVLPIIEDTFDSTICNQHESLHKKTLCGLVVDKYQFIKKIGAGTYGLIYLVKDVSNGYFRAAKITLKNNQMINQNDIDQYKQILQNKITFELTSNPNLHLKELNFDLIKESTVDYLKEISLHLKCHTHANVVTIHNVYSFNIGIITVMDYYSQGDLFKNIVDRRIFEKSNPLMMKNCILQIINVINYLHSKNIYHCDLKPENIMIHYNPNYRRPANDKIIDYNELSIGLIDFGLSMENNLICCNSCRGSSFYMSPERLVNYTKNDYTKHHFDLSIYKTKIDKNGMPMLYFPTLKGDIWSIGVLLINITCARNPWPNSSIVPNNNDVFQTYIYEDRAVLKQILPISTEYNCLLNKIFKLDPNERIELDSLFNDVVNVDFFNDSLLTPPESPKIKYH